MGNFLKWADEYKKQEFHTALSKVKKRIKSGQNGG